MSKKSKHPRAARRIKLNGGAIDALAQQERAFMTKFGRAPGPDDPVFFDPDASSPQPLRTDDAEQQLVLAMEKIGADPALIYAFKLTGLILDEESYQRISSEHRAAYDAAIDEYSRLDIAALGKMS